MNEVIESTLFLILLSAIRVHSALVGTILMPRQQYSYWRIDSEELTKDTIITQRSNGIYYVVHY